MFGGGALATIGGPGGPAQLSNMAVARKESIPTLSPYQDPLSNSQPPSGRNSPALSIQTHRTTRQGSISSNAPSRPVRGNSGSTQLQSPLKTTLDSYSAKNVAAALENGAEGRQVDDVWQAICIRVLPLFNGEGHKGFVEDLNELVMSHVQRTFQRVQLSSRPKTTAPLSSNVTTLVTGLLIADLSELINIGCLTLGGKLAPSPPAPPLTDEHFLIRLNEVWSFFWTGVLPNLEGIFWVLRCDERLKAAVGATYREGRSARGEQRIDVRQLALLGFRDQLVHPQFDRILDLFRGLYESRPSSRRPSEPDFEGVSRQPSRSPRRTPPPHRPSAQSFTSSGTHATLVPFYSPSSSLRPPTSTAPGGGPSSAQAANNRRRQMIAILAGLLTADERQDEIDTLLSHMRATVLPGSRSPTMALDIVTPGAEPSSYDLGDSSSSQKPPISPLHTFPAAGTPLATPPRLPTRSGTPDRFFQRSRAGTTTSLDLDDAATIERAVGSQSTVKGAGGRRKGFLTLLGRSKSGSANDSTTSSTPTTTRATSVSTAKGVEEILGTPVRGNLMARGESEDDISRIIGGGEELGKSAHN
ncbi:hypothetical protein T439DRAFT_349406 [Meredithblackwellia eburnea MCA 4105]